MEISEKGKKLINKEISISDLSSKEVKDISKSIKKELELKKSELNNLNEQIKNMKKRIDNWAN